MARFKINQSALDALGRQAVEKFNARMQPVLDEVFNSHAGQPVDEIKAVLADKWREKANGDLDEPLLTNIATKISEGTHVTLTDKG